MLWTIYIYTLGEIKEQAGNFDFLRLSPYIFSFLFNPKLQGFKISVGSPNNLIITGCDGGCEGIPPHSTSLRGCVCSEGFGETVAKSP